MIVERDGVALYAVEAGDGPAVVLLHGHSLDLRCWDGLVPVLTASGLRVIRYDQRGHGRSGSPPAHYGWGDHAADLAAVLDRFGARPAHVVGLSKGGGIALELALRQPDAVRSLLLVGPFIPDAPLSDGLVASFREFARRIREHGPQAAVEGFWLGHPLIATGHALPGVRERIEAMTLAFPAGEYLASRRDPTDRSWKVTDRLAEVGVPTLVVIGEHEIPDFRNMAALLAERAPGSRLEVVAGAGHLVPLERPDEFARLACLFLTAPAAASEQTA